MTWKRRYRVRWLERLGNPREPGPTFSIAGLMVLLLLAGCSGAASTPQPASTTGSASTLTPTSGPSTGVTIPASQQSPSASLEAGALVIDGEQATAVSVPDPSQTASYAMTADSLYRSNQSGGWDQIGSWDTSRSLLVDPTNSDVLYSGGHPGCAVGGAAITLQKSRDGGHTWQTLLTGQNVRPMIVDPSNPQVIYGERCSLAISTDGGETWSDYPMTPSFDVSDMSLAGSTLYVLVTSEGGTSHIRPVDVSNPAQPQMRADRHQFWGGGTIEASPSRIIVGEPHGVDVSADGGQTWTFSRTGLESVTVSVNALVEPIPNTELAGKFGIYSLAVDPHDATHLFAGTVRGLYESHDTGVTWTPVSSINQVVVSEVDFAQDGSRLYVTTDSGVVVLSM